MFENILQNIAMQIFTVCCIHLNKYVLMANWVHFNDKKEHQFTKEYKVSLKLVFSIQDHPLQLWSLNK